MANAANCFETLLYPECAGADEHAVFNPSADLNGDGKIDNHDLYLLPAVYTSVGATAAATKAQDAILRRGNINGQFGTDSYDITALYQKIGQTYTWYADLNSDGAVDQGDVDTIVHTIFGTEYGDANLDQSVNALDFNAVGEQFRPHRRRAGRRRISMAMESSIAATSTRWRAISGSKQRRRMRWRRASEQRSRNRRVLI